MPPRAIDPTELVDMAHYRPDEHHTLDIMVAYATSDKRINAFDKLYRDNAPLCLHKAMADVVVDAAKTLNHTHGWKLQLLDGLRTLDAQILMKESKTTDPLWFALGKLSTPGFGGHPKGMAIDLMPLDASGSPIDMGTGFDHLYPEDLARRDYSSDGITPETKQNRVIVEAAMLRAAFAQGRLLAPLESEHWDYRFPENIADGWRVLKAVARVAHVPFDQVRWQKEFKNYGEFKAAWNELFKDSTEVLMKAIGTDTPPASERSVIYHGDYFPLRNQDLPKSLRQTEPDEVLDAKATAVLEQRKSAMMGDSPFKD